MSDTPREVSLDQVMASVDESRRTALKRLLAGSAAFAVPLITAIVKSSNAQAAAGGKFGKGGFGGKSGGKGGGKGIG